MSTLLDVLVAILLLLGAGLNLVAALGLHRLPDVFCRMHAATKPATLGLLLVLAGTTVALGDTQATTKLVLVAVLQFVTNPVGGHMVGRAAWHAQEDPGPVHDALPPPRG